MTQPTVRDVWRLALPDGSQRCNRQGELGRRVAWTHRMAAHPPAFANLEQDEIVLVAAPQLPLLDDRLSLADVILHLGEKQIAALAVSGEVDDAAIETADRYRICLIRLPDTADLRTVEHDIIRLIVERDAQLDRRGRVIYRQLAQASIGNQGLRPIAETLYRIVNKVVLIQDERGQIVATAPETEAAALLSLPDVAAALLAHPSPPADCTLDDKAPPCAVEILPDAHLHRCVVTIVVENQPVGYVSILAHRTGSTDAHALAGEDTLDELDQLAAERCALVCALEAAKQRAVLATELRMRGDFLNALLSGSPAEEPALAQRALEMGYAVEGEHVAMLIDLQRTRIGMRAPIVSELRARLFAKGVDFLLCSLDHSIALIWRVAPTSLGEDHERDAKVVFRQLTYLSPEVQITVGLGRRGAGIAGLRRSLCQARETLDLACQLGQQGTVLVFGDLALYHVLHRLQESEESRLFAERTLGALVAYDRLHEGALLSTLAAFFQHHGNVSQTADSLHLHRNSLIYRLERIAAITGHDLDDAEDRFALQLALKLRTLVPTADHHADEDRATPGL